MKIEIIKVKQNNNIFYIGKIKAKDLIRIATTKVRKKLTVKDYENYLSEIDDSIKAKINEGELWYLKDLEESPNIQREQSKKRLKEIGEYIKKLDSIFPNSIIINLVDKENDGYYSTANNVKVYDNYIEFNDEKVIASIIDGQHRLGGFKYTSSDNNEINEYLEKYELVVTIMVGVSIPQQAELFATINGKQTPVNKSILYDLTDVSENEYTELVTAHLITKWFNIYEKSPLKGMIKMLGTGVGSISQSALIDSILPLIEDKNIKFDYSDYKKNLLIPIFRHEYLEKNNKHIMNNLYNYFKAFKSVFPKEWSSMGEGKNNVKYILNKTTGIGGILIAYPTIYCYLNNINDYSYKIVESLIMILKNNNFQFTSDKYKGGSKQTQKDLAIDILEMIFNKDEKIKYQENFIKKMNISLSNI